MPTPVRTPRLNNNDDTVRLQRMLAAVGDTVRAGDAVAEVESDKASVAIEAEEDGHIIEICAREGEVVAVGSILAWLGETPDARVPAAAASVAPASENGSAGRRLTLKARMQLAREAQDARDTRDAPTPPAGPGEPGRWMPLSPEERGLLRAVTWHQGAAVPGYIELRYDPEPWTRYAAAVQDAEQLLFSPLLALMVRHLAAIARSQPNVNATIVNDRKYLYDDVNVGLAVQGGSQLYLVVVPRADQLSARACCDRVTELQRRAMADALTAPEISGATIALTSMARWNVSRHIPVLPPYTSVIVAHSAASNGEATLGATYDHRLLTGADIVMLLDRLSRPPE